MTVLSNIELCKSVSLVTFWVHRNAGRILNSGRCEERKLSLGARREIESMWRESASAWRSSEEDLHVILWETNRVVIRGNREREKCSDGRMFFWKIVHAKKKNRNRHVKKLYLWSAVQRSVYVIIVRFKGFLWVVDILTDRSVKSLRRSCLVRWICWTHELIQS